MATRSDWKVWIFSKPSLDGTVASGRIGDFIARTLGLPLVHDEAVTERPEDGLIIVNGAFAFCNHLRELAVAVRRATRIVWVQNDYTIAPPKAESAGKSPFRAAFRLRAKDGKPPMSFWTTCLPLPTEDSTYVNWNALTYEPLRTKPCAWKKTLLYYGAHRAGRVQAFERYLTGHVEGLERVISSTSAKFDSYDHRIGGDCVVAPAFPRSMFYTSLAQHGLGLYLEDDRSHRQFHSPANRFYEMLSAGLPMVFQPECVPMLQQASYDVRPYVVKDAAQAALTMKHREKIAAEQRKAWSRDYVKFLEQRVRLTFAKECKR